MTIFPDVPIAPGVPPVPRLPGTLSTTISILTADAIQLFGLISGPLWGVYQNGSPVLVASTLPNLGVITNFIGLALPTIVADSIVSFGYKQDWRIPTYPVEQGGFQSYDKVQLPFDVRLRVSVGGTPARRQALLTAVNTIANSLNLYDIVTPELTYLSCNCVHYDYERTNTNGVGMITADMFFTEVRVVQTQTFSTNTLNPTDQNAQGLGAVQTSPSSPNTQNAIATQMYTTTFQPFGLPVPPIPFPFNPTSW